MTETAPPKAPAPAIPVDLILGLIEVLAAFGTLLTEELSIPHAEIAAAMARIGDRQRGLPFNTPLRRLPAATIRLVFERPAAKDRVKARLHSIDGGKPT